MGLFVGIKAVKEVDNFKRLVIFLVCCDWIRCVILVVFDSPFDFLFIVLYDSIVWFCDEVEHIFSYLLEFSFSVSHQILNINQTVHALIFLI